MRNPISRHFPWLLAALLCMPSEFACAAAQDGETLGPTYKIIEPDMLEEMLAKMREQEKSGEIARKQSEAEIRARAYIVTPPPVARIVSSRSERSFYFDPTIRVNRDLITPDGQTIARAGTEFNPLDVTPWPRPWIFLDARDSLQVRKARSLQQKFKHRARLILTGGSWMELSRQLGYQVYFDQKGVLVRKFGIRQVPAVVTQEGKRLRIDEIRP